MIPALDASLESALVRLRDHPSDISERQVQTEIGRFADVLRAEGFLAVDVIIAVKQHLARIGDAAISATRDNESRWDVAARADRLISHAIRCYYRETPPSSSPRERQSQSQ